MVYLSPRDWKLQEAMVPPKKILTPLALAAALLLPATALCDNAGVFEQRAAAEEASGDTAAALNDYNSAYEQYASDLKYAAPATADADRAKMAALGGKIGALANQQARALEKSGDLDGAARDYYEAMDRSRDFAPNYYDCARVDYMLGDLVHALRYSTRAIELKPAYPEALALRGSVKLLAVRLSDALHAGRFSMSGVSIEMAMSMDFVQVKVTDVNLAGALADLDKAVALQPGFAAAWDCRGLAKYFKGDMDGAIDDFTKAIAARADYATAWNNRARARLSKGDWKGALADLDKAVALQPGFAPAYGNRAAAKQAGGDLDGALADLGKAIELKADYLSAYGFRGVLRQVKGDAAGASADFKKSMELSGNITLFQNNWSIFYNDPAFVKQSPGDLDGALAGVEDAPFARPGDAALTAAFAQAYFGRANSAGGWFSPARGVSDLDRAIALKPDFAGAYRQRGMARQYARGYTGDNFFEHSELSPISYVTPGPGDAPAAKPRDAGQAWGDLDGALADLDKAVSLGLRDEKTYAARGGVKQAKGDSAGALADFDAALALSPDDAQLYAQRSVARKALGDAKGARADMARSLDLAITQAKTPPAAGYAYLCRANDKKSRGDTAGALEDFTKAIAAWPDYSTAYTARAWLNYADGDRKTVMADLNKSIALVSDNASNSDAFYLRAMIERDKGDTTAALNDFKKSQSLGSNDRDVWRDIALIDAARGDYDGAYDHFDSALGRWRQFILGNYGDDYKKQFGAWLDGMQADIDSISKLRGTKVEHLFDRFAGGYGGQSAEPGRLTPLISVRPGMAALYCMRGHEYFNHHALPAALADFKKALALGNLPEPSLEEMRLFIWVARARSGDEKAAAAELQAWLDSGAKRPRDAWHTQIACFLADRLPEAGLINAAQSAGNAPDGIENGRLCDAYFYAGEKRLADGDKATAVQYFAKSIGGSQDLQPEYDAAGAELQALNPAPPQ